MSDVNAPAAWYPDPGGSAANRWWDGTAWTEHLRMPELPSPTSRSGWSDVWGEVRDDSRGEVTFVPANPSYHPQPFLPGGEPTRTASPEPMFTQPRVVLPEPAAESDYVPMARRQFRSERREPSLVYTSPAWWIAVSPAWVLALQFVPLIASGTRPLVLLALVGASMLITAALMLLDRRMLLTDGYRRAPSAWWWWLSPLAYLISRGVHTAREVRGGWWTAIVYALLLAGNLAFQLTVGRELFYSELGWESFIPGL